MPITPQQLATELSADIEDVTELTGQLQDEDLYDTDTGLLSDDGAALIRDQLRYSC